MNSPHEAGRRHGRHIHDRSFQWRLWGMPIVLAVLSAVGLLFGLLGDGWWDAVSWIGLGVPVLVCAWFGLPWFRRMGSASGR